MSLQNRLLTVTIVLFSGYSCAHGQLPQLSLVKPNQDQHQMVLLKNGRILQGAVTRDGEDFLVAVNPQSQVRLQGNQVEFSCRNLRDAYTTKHYLMDRSQASEHLAMTEWCLQYNLRKEAADHLLTATSLEPHNPRLPGLERRWRMLERAATSTPARSPATPPHHLKEQRERDLASLPDDVVRQFTTTIQPILLNNCGTSGCHGKNSDAKFHLRRPSWGPAISRGLTQRNLQSTLEHINRQTPSQSRLLSAATQPHAKLTKAVFSDTEAVQLKVLTAWINKCAEIPQPLPSTLVETQETPNPTPTVQQVAQEEPVEPETSEKQSADQSLTPTDASAASPESVVTEPTLTPPRPLPPMPMDQKTNQRFVPKDAFDAEIFNRQQESVATAINNS